MDIQCSKKVFLSSSASAERESKSKSPQVPAKTIPNGTEEKVCVNGTADTADPEMEPDSYEARRMARRKAREERMKAASAKYATCNHNMCFS